jgi:uncharacterized protein (DUF433 family)
MSLPVVLRYRDTLGTMCADHSSIPPARETASGALRVGASRVLLELVIRAVQDNATPEGIVQQYSTLQPRDVDAVVAYYMCNRSDA